MANLLATKAWHGVLWPGPANAYVRPPRKVRCPLCVLAVWKRQDAQSR